MDSLTTLLSERLAVDASLVHLALLAVLGLIAHYSIGVVLRKANRLAERTEQQWDDIVINSLSSPLRVLVWCVVFYLALDVFQFTSALQAFVGNVYGMVLVLLLTWFLRSLIYGVEGEMLREDRGRTASADVASIRATAKLLRVVLWVIAGLMILQSLGVSVSGLLAFGGIGGIAVGFAAKDLLANFFGGLSIYLDRPFTTGDWIRSPDKEIEGTVEDIGWRLTRIRKFDQRPLYVPNAVFSQISVENPSRMYNRRIYETIGLRYEDADKVAVIVEQVREMLTHHDDIDLGRTLIVNFNAFAPSSLDFFIYTFTKTTNWVAYHGIKQEILLKILEIIHMNGADVAFPTSTVHLATGDAEPTA